MQPSFVETMRGTLKAPDGRVTPVDFQIKTSGGAGGRFEARGVVHAPPWTVEAPCEGTLVISVTPPSIAYELHFRGDDGAALVLRGAKSPSVLRPVRSMTVLPISLLEGETQRAAGEMYFDLLELPGFLASWLPLPTTPRRRFDARFAAVTRRALLGG